MQLGRVIGFATATVKHASLNGWRLALVQLLDAAGNPEGDPVLAPGKLNAGVGETVLLNSDGKSARDLIGDPKSPVRWHVLGIVNEKA